jgi:hypothetical protein
MTAAAHTSTTACAVPSTEAAASPCFARIPSLCCSGRYTGARSLPVPSNCRWNPACACLWAALPEALVQTEVFSFLSPAELLTVACVATRFNYMVECAPNWKALSFTPVPASGVGLGRLLQRQQHKIEHLTAHRVSAGTEEEIGVWMGLRMSNLKALDLSGARPQNASFLTNLVQSHGEHLQTLALDSVPCLQAEDVDAILSSVPNLASLSLASNRQLTSATIQTIRQLGMLSRLTSLNLSGCTQLCSQDLEAVMQAAFESSGPLPMQCLQIKGIANLTDKTLAVIAECCPKLTSLDAGNSDPFGTALRMKVRTIRSFGEAGGGAAPLFASHISDAGLLRLAQRLPGLRVLRLQGHSLISDAGFAAAVSQWPQMEILDARGCGFLAHDTMDALATTCTSLRELRVNHCVQLEDCDVYAVVKACSMLSILDVCGCKKLTLRGLQDVAEILGVSSSPLSQKHQLFCGGIPSLVAAMRSLVDTTLMRAGTLESVMATSQPEPLVQISALFPHSISLHMC